MLKNTLLTRVFSSGLQIIAVQILGSVFFYIISVYLSKENFGLINWMNAVCFFLIAFLGCGLEQVVVRRIAASKRSDWAASAFFVHAVAGFLITFSFLFTLRFFSKDNVEAVRFLPWFFAAQGLIYTGIPLKQFLNAKERFTPYGVIAVISNLSKIVAVCLLVQKHQLYIDTVIIVLLCTSFFEFCCLLTYVITQTSFNFRARFKAYLLLIKEATAQYLSVIFDMSLSRMDWLLLGLLTTNVILADYSFAYRAYELARLPMLIIAPVILPRLSRLMVSNNNPSPVQKDLISSFNTVEMFFGVLIPLTLNILWAPVISLITKGKYGSANSLEFLILSLCIPLQFFINLLWSLCFAAKKYRKVSTITFIAAITNIVLNLSLISIFKGLGAAIAFLITNILQAFLYYALVQKEIMPIFLRPAIIFVTTATIIYFIAIHLKFNFFAQAAAAIVLYILAAILSKQISKRHISDFKHFLSG